MARNTPDADTPLLLNKGVQILLLWLAVVVFTLLGNFLRIELSAPAFIALGLAWIFSNLVGKSDVFFKWISGSLVIALLAIAYFHYELGVCFAGSCP